MKKQSVKIEIANEVGYENYSSFSKMFIQITDFSPENYRIEYRYKKK